MDALKSQQSSFQKTTRNDLNTYMSTKIRDQRMVAMGRLPPQQDAGPLFANMITAMMKGTWNVFEAAISFHLKNLCPPRSFEDFESLDNPDSLVNILIANNRPKNPKEAPSCAHLQVEWTRELAAKLLDVGFTIADVCRLELLAHLYVIVNSPVRPQALFDNKASLVYATIMVVTGKPRLSQVHLGVSSCTVSHQTDHTTALMQLNLYSVLCALACNIRVLWYFARLHATYAPSH